MDVELDIFSGRENPHWKVSSADIDHRLANLRKEPPAEMQIPGLGYRGVLVRVGSDLLRVYKGFVLAQTWSARDAERSLERQLVDSGALLLDPQLMTQVANAIGA